MPNPFKEFFDFMPASKQDLDELEARLMAVLLVIASGDKQRLEALTAQLKQSATALQDAVNKNK